MEQAVTKSWLTNEWRLLVSIMAPVLAVAGMYYLLRTDVQILLYRVDKIENNHLAHMQASLDKLTDAMEKLTVQETQTSTLLNQHLNEK